MRRVGVWFLLFVAGVTVLCTLVQFHLGFLFVPVLLLTVAALVVFFYCLAQP